MNFRHLLSCDTIVEKLSTSEVISQKPHGEGGVENTPSAFRVISGVTHSSAMSLSVNLGWPTLFLAQITFWCEYGLSQCFF